MSEERIVTEHDYSEVFLDTSILLDYVLGQDDGSAKSVLSQHRSRNLIGDTVEREFSGIKERREKILQSIFDCRNLEDWEPPASVDMSQNDRTWCAELLARLDRLSDRQKVETRLSQEERKFIRGEEKLFDEPSPWIDDIWPGHRDASLLGSLRFINNRNDQKIVCESADWATDNPADNLLTADQDDLLSQKDRILEEIDRNRSVDSLSLFSAPEFLDSDPNFSG